MQKGSTLALKSRANVTRSPKQGYQWPHERDLCPQKIKNSHVDLNASSPVSCDQIFTLFCNVMSNMIYF